MTSSSVINALSYFALLKHGIVKCNINRGGHPIIFLISDNR
jgi:hypothetical protein